MQKFGAAFGVLFFSSQAFGISVGAHSGSGFTSGPGLNHFSLNSAAKNPGMAPLMVPDEETWRISYLPSFSISVEIGDVDNFADDLDELIDLVDDSSTITESATEIRDRFNGVLELMGEEGYLKTGVTVHAPIVPLYMESESLGGTFFADIAVNTSVAALVLDDELVLDALTQDFTTNTSIYLKSAIETKFTVGYGRQIFKESAMLKDKGNLYAGVNLSVIQMELSKQVTRIEDLDGQEVVDVIEDIYDDNLKSTTGFALDLGLVWDADWYRAGLTIDNLNSPEFDYGPVGVNCEDIDVNDIVERNGCEIAATFVAEGRLRAREKHTKHAVIRADGLLQLTDRWFLTGALDLADYDDAVGFKNQWMHLATSYEFKNRYVSSTRAGYQKNLAGTELSSFNFGFTFFRSISLDFQWSTESVDVDGDSAPRLAGFALAFEESF